MTTGVLRSVGKRVASMAARLDDALSPIAVKELRQAVNARYISVVLLLCLGAQLLVLAVVTLGNRLDYTSEAGPDTFVILYGILVGTCTVLVPLYVFGRSIAERSGTDADLFSMTALRARAIVSGRLCSGMALVGLVYSACAPFLVFTYFLRGLDLGRILAALVVGLAVSLVVMQIAVLFACLRILVRAKALLTPFLVGAGGIGFALARRFSVGVVVHGTSITSAGPRVGLDLIAGCAILAVWLIFTVAVAAISPRSADRARPVRVCVTVIWLIVLAGIALWSLIIDSHYLVGYWIAASVGVFSLGLFVAIGERDTYGPRIIRAVPRRTWRRYLSFLFTSGAAGGLVWCCTGIVLTLLIAEVWCLCFVPTKGFVNAAAIMESFIALLGIASAYVYSYCLTGVLIRRRFLRAPDSAYTFIAAIAVAAIAFIGFIWINDPYTHEGPIVLANLPNPMILTEGWRASFALPALAFSSAWAVIVTLLNRKWLMGQWRAFRPPEGSVQLPVNDE